MTNPVHTALQRVGPLSQLGAVLKAQGIDIAAVLDGLPVTEADLRPDAYLPLGVISALLDRAAARTGLDDIGLRLASKQNHMALGGPMGQLMMSCETLGSALGTFAALQMTNSTAAAVYLQPMGEDYALGFGVYAPELPSSHIYDASIAVGFNILQDLTAGNVRPLEVLISRAEPPDPEPYLRYFRCPVRFNEGQSCLIIAGSSMDFKLPTANAKLRESLITALQKQLAQQPQGFVARVKHALRPLLLAGGASHRQVAAHLNIHPRTMGRRLEAEGLTFEQLKDEVRLVASRDLLARTEMAISDVAAALGYATPSAFVRAFRRWTGSPPSAWRRQFHSKGQ
jgi:AraC-like DNA-binding protein